jgi:H+/Cl- antiporter ClcA
LNKFFRTTIILLSAIALGLLTGAISAGFLHIIDFGQTFIWESPWAEFQFYPLILCSIGGVFVGLCQKYLGDHPKDLQQSISDIKNNGRIEYKHLSKGVLAAGTSLIFGASLGPEAAIMGLIGGLTTWSADTLAKIRAKLGFTNIPLIGNRIKFYLHKWPNILVILLGIFSFGFGVKNLYSSSFLQITERFSANDIFWSIPLGMIGALLGALFVFLMKQSKRVLLPLEKRPVIKASLAGIFLGLTASLFPTMLFSGQHEIQHTYEHAVQFGAGLLFLIAFLRLINISFLLNSGWKGGQFLPLMFASTTFGLACSVLIPGISAPTGIFATMSGLLVMVMPNHWIVIALMAMMFPIEYIVVILAAVLSAVFVKTLLDNRQAIANKSQIGITEMKKQNTP